METIVFLFLGFVGFQGLAWPASWPVRHTHWASELQSMSPDKLNTLMKLGAGVSKVIDIKDKLLNKS